LFLTTAAALRHAWRAVANLFSLAGNVAVVIGGTSGLGRSIAFGLADAGADVVATSRRLDQVEIAAAEIEARGRRTLRQASDVVDRASLESLLSSTVAALGKVDVLVNCAGRIKKAPTLDFAEDEWQAILDTNLTGTLRACQVFGRHMIDRRQGCIINIASIGALRALYQVAAYCASKAAVAALTKSLAVEWAPHGVRVNAIVPGVIPTPLNASLLDGTPRGQEFLIRTPMRRFGRADELAGAAIFLASEASTFVTGELLCVDGGMLAAGVTQ
jgi:NAD(P)-dependent dehydrogenase (short-subunit alcohol dehydrogenase family)